MSKPPIVVGIGEILWDLFPGRESVGGAPANFAHHSGQLGALAYPVTCIGVDSLGGRLRARLGEMNLDSRYVMDCDSLPTGTATVTLDESAKPTFAINLDAAWSHLSVTPELLELAETLDAICFGTLSQQSRQSREAIQTIVARTRESALRILDVNLRSPYYSKAIVEQSLELANVLKLSDDELPILAEYFELTGDRLEQLQALRCRFDLRLIACTLGAAGSLLVGADEVDATPCEPGIVVDSVGAGDSFTAALCAGLLRGWTLKRINQFANRVAGYVCSQVGATPILPEALILNQSDGDLREIHP